jgi:hypothetical protein
MWQMHFSDPWNIISDPNKTFIWEDDAVAFYTRYKYVLALCAVLYLPIVFTLQRIMKDREAYKLSGLLKVEKIIFFSLFHYFNTMEFKTIFCFHSVLIPTTVF